LKLFFGKDILSIVINPEIPIFAGLAQNRGPLTPHARLLEKQNFNTMDKHFVTADHNESKRFFKMFYYWNWFKMRFRLSIIDIRKFL